MPKKQKTFGKLLHFPKVLHTIIYATKLSEIETLSEMNQSDSVG